MLLRRKWPQPRRESFQLGLSPARPAFSEEAGTEAVQPDETLQSLLCGLCGRMIRISQQIGCCPHPAAANTATQLMQLRKAEPVRPPDQHGIGVRQVQPGLDNGS